MKVTDTSDLWWKTAVVYNLDVETYLDWNDDGVGDFQGLAHRIDYLAELGVTCLWLAPFYPSPQKDNGYDITDYYGVDPRYGHLGDVVEVFRTAKDRGIRVIVDLVVNHTSDQHPWFKEALKGKDNPFRDYYRWRDEPPKNQAENAFPDTEDGTWFLDEKSGQYYRHSFYRHQPDLNTANPQVRDEIAKIIGFWFQLGVDGFRVDAVPYLLDDDTPDDPYDFLRTLRRYVGRRSGTGMLLGEVNLPHDEQYEFFGEADGDGLTMQFDFVTNQALYLALAREDARPLRDSLRSRPQLESSNQWGNFVRNHDELNLNQLSEEDRQFVFERFAPDESMRLHGRGIRRRLPPLIDGDPRRLEMVYSLIFSLPGAPVLYYGEEIGMGENLDLAGREAVRSPMQWSDEENGGFSSAPKRKLVTTVPEGGFSPEYVNVAQQRHVDSSLFTFVRGLVQTYRNSPEIGWGDFAIVDQPFDEVLAHTVRTETGHLFAVHNLGPEPHTVPVTIEDVVPGTRVVDLFHDHILLPDEKGRLDVPLDGYGHRWLRVVRPGDKRLT
ncbi:trehalose synthase [Labedella gwakjiensis]|uniref:Alpha-amylase n=1 Tax=Labedella gwakjiensis TaxID=390269 RepID=A0A2P8GYP8_9MICO|nr:alpha-amylase family protein [Labedella gwakjiensis]PSL39093.1 trehalose synthase [Labedella gwakjiensis]RUQ86460.1 trehalose synthase [Labedella gwakjiensis]